jgi:6,7-dimethyl-8-ribityllumazine synthase
LNSRRVLRRLVPAFSPKELEGDTSAAGLRFAVLCARWNPTVTEALLQAALRTLSRRGARAADVTVVRVPGAFELPAAARAVVEKGRTDALVALGAIVRGQTTHYDVLGHAVATALAGLSADTGLPIGFGVLTCDTMEQARERSGKGAEAAEAAIEMANLRRRIWRR